MAPWQYSKIHIWKCWQWKISAQCRYRRILPTRRGQGDNFPDLCVTPERPDIGIHDRLTNELVIFELTVQLETNILNAHTRKAEKYFHFIPDITSANVKVIPFEIGSRGYISPDNKTSRNCCSSTARRKPHTERSWKIFLQSPFTPPTTYLYKRNPTMGPPPTTNPQSVLKPS